ncbi:C2 domain in Dock180 and Zizimin proteins-domain-containing protein [Gorgonomyces haynaldii]|nr:C2 domain in Dock180 and Zizimin proteins-domain-containing protein [Gorgonomyces haynaldii]
MTWTQENAVGLIIHSYQDLLAGTLVQIIESQQDWLRCHYDPKNPKTTVLPRSCVLVLKESLVKRDDHHMPPLNVSWQLTSSLFQNHIISALNDWVQQYERSFEARDYATCKYIAKTVQDVASLFDILEKGHLTAQEQQEHHKLIQDKMIECNHRIGLPLFIYKEQELLSHENCQILELYQHYLELKQPQAQQNQSKGTHHLLVKIMAGSHALCERGESAELVFFIYDLDKKQQLTHNHVVLLNADGLPANASQMDNLSVLFQSLTSGQLRESLYLVVFLIRVGPDTSKDEVDTFGLSKSVKQLRSKLSKANLKSTVGPSIRRPIGSTFINLKDLFVQDADIYADTKEYRLQVLTPGLEGFAHLEGSSQREPQVSSDIFLMLNMAVLSDLGTGFDLGPQVPIVTRTGAQNAVQPKTGTNCIYVTLQDGTFSNSWKNGYKSVQVNVRVRKSDGTFLPCISYEEPQKQRLEYQSCVYPKNASPSWNETIRVDLLPQQVQECHLYFTFHHCSGDATEPSEFAFAFLPLTKSQFSVMHDGSHSLTLYKSDPAFSIPSLYLNFPAGDHIFVPTHLSASSIQDLAAAADAMAKLPAIKDTFNVKTLLFSTLLTQDMCVVNLLYWSQALYQNRGQLLQILQEFERVGEMELIKFLPALISACLEMLSVSMENSNLRDIVSPHVFKIFETLVFILNVAVDKRFTVQCEEAFEQLDKKPIKRGVALLLAEQMRTLITEASSMEKAKVLRKAIKVWHMIMHLVVKSEPRDEIKNATDAFLSSLESFMLPSDLDHIVLCQILSLQQLHLLVDETKILFTDEEMFERLEIMMDNLSGATDNMKFHRLAALKMLHSKQVFKEMKPLERMILMHLLTTFHESDRRKSFSQRLLLDKNLVSGATGLMNTVMQSYQSFSEDALLWGECMNLLTSLLLVHLNEKGTEAASLTALLVTILNKMQKFGFTQIQEMVRDTLGVQGLGYWTLGLVTAFKAILVSPLIRQEWATFFIGISTTVFHVLEATKQVMETISTNRCEVSEVLWQTYLQTVVEFCLLPSLRSDNVCLQSSLVYQHLKFDYSPESVDLLYDAFTTCRRLHQTQHLLKCLPMDFMRLLLQMCFDDYSLARSVAIDILYFLILDYFSIHKDLRQFEMHFLFNLNLFDRQPSTMNRFLSGLESRIQKDPEQECFQHCNNLLKSVKKFSKLLLAQRDAKSLDLEEQLAASLKMIKFVRQIRHSGLLSAYVAQIYNTHLSRKNQTEAALALMLLAETLSWTSKEVATPIALKGYDEHQPEHERKENMYLEAIQLLINGQCWERAIESSKQLAQHYEQSFNYEGVAETHSVRSTLYTKIMTEDRVFPHYYRVVFCGKEFSKHLANKQFIYRASQWEPISSFCERMQAMYADCKIITSTAPQPETEGKVLQITAVQPNPDFRLWKQCLLKGNLFDLIHTKPTQEHGSPFWLYEPCLFGDDLEARAVLDQIDTIPQPLGDYYRYNEVSTFSFSRPVRRPSDAFKNHPAREILEIHTEKIVLHTEEQFPFPGMRSRVRQLISFEMKPIETAILTIRLKTRQLLELRQKYERHTLSSKKRQSYAGIRSSLGSSANESMASINHNPFTMALKGAIDAPVNGGVQMYKLAFLTDDHISRKSGATPELCQALESAIAEQVLELIQGRCHQILS